MYTENKMETQTVFIIIAVIGIICGIIMREVARKRGANQIFWFVVGLLLAPIALLFIPFIKKKMKFF